MQAEKVGDRIELRNTSYRDKDACRSLPGASYKNGQWTATLSWPTLRIIRSLWPDIESGPDLIVWSWEEYLGRIEPVQSVRERAIDPTQRMNLEIPVPGLYPYQTTGVSFLGHAHGAILADEMGTGKTAQVIGTLEQDNYYPALVVCPAGAKQAWAREFAKWSPHRLVQVVGGTIGQRRKQIADSHYDVLVINYESLRSHTRLAPYGSTRLTAIERVPKELNAINWDAVIVDEAHRIVNPHTQQTRAVWGVSTEADLRVALTGTPIANAPDDLWALLHFVAPEEWPSKSKFLDRYCKLEYNVFGGMSVSGLNPHTADEFHDLVNLRYLRRPKAVVLPWLPPKVYERIDVEMTPKQRKAYVSFRDDCVAQFDSGTALAIDPLTTLTRLSQLASASADIDTNGQVRLCLPSSKVDALLGVLDDMGDEPLVVFAMSRQLIELTEQALIEKGISCSVVIGGQGDIARQQAVDSFQENRVRVILLTLGAGSEAITLTAASTVCFMQRSWSMVQNRQAEDRIHRPGQTASSVTIIDLVAPDTVEEHILAAVDAKGEMLEEIVQDREAIRRMLA